MIQQAQSLTDHLILLCNQKVDKTINKMSMSKDFRYLQRLAANLEIIIPLQSSMTVSLPLSSETYSTHSPFTSSLPAIAGLKLLILGFVDEIEIMHSLQRPRKITIVGSDGKFYIFLCKPEDDLRKDSRLMELNSIINRLLIKDSESRKRGLQISTYAVIPLNEKCGLIEWVPNTTGFRNILNKIYQAKNICIPVCNC